MDKTKPIVGTIALTKGFGKLAVKKNKTIIKYVKSEIIIFLVSEVSHALSSSTFLFLSFSFIISVSIFFDMIDFHFFILNNLKAAATSSGKVIVASPQTLTLSPFTPSAFPQDFASSGLAPALLPSASYPVLR